MNLKYTFILSLLFVTLSACSQPALIKLNELQTGDYVSCINYKEVNNLLAFSAGSSDTYLCDSNLKVIRKFSYDALWGGGGPGFSFDRKYMAFVRFGDDRDSISIYNLEKDNLFHLSVSAYNLKFFNHSSRILFTRNGTFNLYDIENARLEKEVFEAGTLPYQFFSSYCISPDDSFVFASTSKGFIEVYNTISWGKTATYGPFGEIENLKYLSGTKKLIFNVKNVLMVFSTVDNKMHNHITTDMNNINDIAIGHKENEIIIAGSGGKVCNAYLYRQDDKKLQLLDFKEKSENYYSAFLNETGTTVLLGGESGLSVFALKRK